MNEFLMKKKMEKNQLRNVPLSFLISLQQSLLSLTIMADQKGSVLLGFNFLIISFIVTQMVLHGLRIDLLIFLFFSLSIVLLAIRVLSPRLFYGVNLSQNVLFFNEIARMGEAAFTEQVLDLLYSDRMIYVTMIKHVHQMSLVLQKKYQYLRWAYRVCFAACVIGMMILLFVVATMYPTRSVPY